MTRRIPLASIGLGGAVLLVLPAVAAAAPVPRATALSRGWEVRAVPAAPAAPQPPPGEETSPPNTPPSTPTLLPPLTARASQAPSEWQPVQVPSVFDARALPGLYPGSVRVYRVSFRGPDTPRGFRWLLRFEEVRRSARVYLNGRRVGRNTDPYTPFFVEARGLRPGRRNQLRVVVDNRKNPGLREGWWNWGGIIRPVRLLPVGRAYLSGLGVLSRVRCRRPARACTGRFVIDGTLQRRGRGSVAPALTVRLRAPNGRVRKKTFRLPAQRPRSRRLRLSLKVPSPELWSPDRPQLYAARLTLRDRGAVTQVERKRVGLRSVQVRRGALYLNNRRVQMRGASIHEDMPGNGAALSAADMDRIVSDLKAVGANVTRAHYLLNDRLLSRLDRAGIMVWNQAPIWQRDRGPNLLFSRAQRRRALLTVRRTVTAARSHPSVITHSVANELLSNPDERAPTRLFLTGAARLARRLDPTIPISLDVNGRPGYPEQFTYGAFDMLGINQYFGWYRWVSNFDDLEPYLREMRDLYPRHALVMTEFGAEARPELAKAPPDQKGGYAFQALHVSRTLDVVDRLPFLSGAIYWTLREFEIYPGWTGGAGRRADQYEPNTRHNKGLLTYEGDPKPAWFVTRDRFAATPLYRP